MPIPALLPLFSLAVALIMAPLQASHAQDQDAAEIQRYQDWAVRCGPLITGDGKKVERCVMIQIAGKDNTPIAQIELTRSPQKDQYITQFTTPLGSVLTTGLRLQIDDGEVIRLPYQFCMNTGCRVVLPAKQEFIDSMQKGRTLHIAFDLINGKTANAQISLLGFTSALDAISN